MYPLLHGWIILSQNETLGFFAVDTKLQRKDVNKHEPLLFATDTTETLKFSCCFRLPGKSLHRHEVFLHV